MDLRDQRYMTAIAQEGSMTKAAKILGISQPALSRFLDRLEEETGCLLVIRSKRQLVLTHSGQIYLDGCRQCLREASLLREKMNALRSKDEGKRKIIVGGSIIRGARVFAPLYAEFIKAYPDITLDADFAVNRVLIEKVRDGEITLAILGATETVMEEIEYMKFLDEELLVMLPPGHPLGYDYRSLPANVPFPVMDLSRLRGTPLVVQNQETSYFEPLYRLLQANGLEQDIIFRSNIIPLLYDMVKAGAGAAILPSAYFQPEDGISAFSLNPKMVVYQGIGVRKDTVIDEPLAFVVHRIMDGWGSPYYMHRYADYYLEQRQLRAEISEENE